VLIAFIFTVHEAALAVERVSPEKFWSFSTALFEKQLDYFDVNVVNETRNQTYKRLSQLAESVGVDQQAVYDLLVVPSKAKDGSYNLGNKVTDDLKLITKVCICISVFLHPSKYIYK